MRLLSQLAGPSLASIVTRLALGAFPVLFVLVLRASYGKDAFDLAAAAINWSSYLNVLVLSGFALVPPAVARLCAAHAEGRPADTADVDAVRDHRALGRWLLAASVAGAVALGLTVERTFGTLAARQDGVLATWFLLFALLALSQVPLALWLGVAQAVGRYRAALLTTAVPRLAALAALPVASALGAGATVAIAAAVGIVLAGQALLATRARGELGALGAGATRGGDARRVLGANVMAGLVVLVGTLVTIVPVTLVGRVVPDQVGVAHVIVSLANALGGVVVAAYFPRSLTLQQWLHEPGGLTRYCLRVAVGVGVLTIGALAALALAAAACMSLLAACAPAVLWTLALVLAGAGMRLSALGTQHAAMYLGRPQLNVLSATMEAAGALALLLWLLPRLGLTALGWALLMGGAVRLTLALGIERRWLTGTLQWR